ncbi:hypothetical protein [Segeticoccus rhizosphaerae]|uniref:hypothetical protein n=1 Tax=Segeticoccus rhizosphaerae TaxID=1104777 RepID=UPI0010C047D9|nr:hypothetical protein [Ornithinicoccus soli]
MRTSLEGKPLFRARTIGGDVQRLASYATILSALLPYIRTSPLTSDVQPHFLIAFFGLYIWSRSSACYADRRALWAFALSLVYGLPLFLLGYVPYALGIAFVPVFTIFLLHEDRKLVDRCMKIASVIYALGCLVEVVGGRRWVDLFLANARASDTRGLHSFASEPSYLAIVGLVLFTYFLWDQHGKAWVAIAIAIVLSSGAITGIAPLLIVGALFSCSRLRLKHIAAFVAIAGLSGFLISQVISSDSRLYRVLEIVRLGPSALLDDVSAANRLVRSVGPLYLAMKDSFLPHLYGDADRLFVGWSFITERADPYIEGLSNLMSVLVYVFGFLAVPFLLIAIRGIVGRAFVLATAAYLCVTNISVATPYVCLIFALLYVRSGERIEGRVERTGDSMVHLR